MVIRSAKFLSFIYKFLSGHLPLKLPNYWCHFCNSVKRYRDSYRLLACSHKCYQNRSSTCWYWLSEKVETENSLVRTQQQKSKKKKGFLLSALRICIKCKFRAARDIISSLRTSLVPENQDQVFPLNKISTYYISNLFWKCRHLVSVDLLC